MTIWDILLAAIPLIDMSLPVPTEVFGQERLGSSTYPRAVIPMR